MVPSRSYNTATLWHLNAGGAPSTATLAEGRLNNCTLFGRWPETYFVAQQCIQVPQRQRLQPSITHTVSWVIDGLKKVVLVGDVTGLAEIS